jgi:soluble lytic murein transglycosylase-like protein
VSAIPSAIVSAANNAGVPPDLSLEVAIQESSLDPNAVGAAGEVGIYQLMPATAAQLGVDPADVNQNIAGGNALLAQLYAQFGDWRMALAAYNCGPTCVSNAVKNYGANWFSHVPVSTQSYVNSIMGNLGSQYTVVPAPLTPVPAVSSAGLLPASTSSGTFQNALGWLAIAAGVILGLNLLMREA